MDAKLRRRAQDQLEAIASLDRLLRRRNVDYWLFGGWAVDFCVGRVTREHDDVDIAAWRDQSDALRRALTSGGWTHTPRSDDDAATRYTFGPTELEVTFVALDDEGNVVIPFARNPVIWASTPFGDERRELLGRRARTIDLELLKAGKAHAREPEIDAVKDRADFKALTAHT